MARSDLSYGSCFFYAKSAGVVKSIDGQIGINGKEDLSYGSCFFYAKSAVVKSIDGQIGINGKEAAGMLLSSSD
ncbi:hypothetical protein TRIUR3_30475 [Triticum urartu]|uniref:Uncharacterized protein n=1 Tax=Triticum urartu TaxID=4572 RepID=M7Z024_TRIUA|nr:hypothetical protein TRIUR3_30475 [Triticum urartu]